MAVPAGASLVRAWKPAVAGIREVLHARFTDHAYPPHTHDVWTLFVVDDGAIQYDLDRRPHHAEPTLVTILPPHVVHDGRPATSAGYRKRVLYLEPGALDERLVGPAVDRPVVPDEGLRSRLDGLHEALVCRDDTLEAETRFAFILERLAAALGGSMPGPAARPASENPEDAERLRAYLDEHLFGPVTLGEAGQALDMPVTRLARSFSSVFGLPPHAYVIGRRLDAARDRILAGQPLADVASEVGFYDQAHLTRRFKRFLGIAPGSYRRGVRPG